MRPAETRETEPRPGGATLPTAWRAHLPHLLLLAAAGCGLVFWRGEPPRAGEAVWLLLLLGLIAARALWLVATRGSRVADDRRDAAEKGLLLLAFAGMVLVPLVSVSTPLLAFADHPVPGALLAFAPMYARRVRTEEAMMVERFGEAWRAHAARTGRLLPLLRPRGTRSA